MGLTKKINKAYLAGFMYGCEETWNLIENAVNRVEGIGPKRQEAILKAIREMAESVVTQGERGGAQWQQLDEDKLKKIMLNK